MIRWKIASTCPESSKLSVGNCQTSLKMEREGKSWKQLEQKITGKGEKIWNAKRRKSQGRKESSLGQGIERGSDWKCERCRLHQKSYLFHMFAGNWPSYPTIALRSIALGVPTWWKKEGPCVSPPPHPSLTVSTPTRAIPGSLQGEQNKHIYKFIQQIAIKSLQQWTKQKLSPSSRCLKSSGKGIK